MQCPRSAWAPPSVFGQVISPSSSISTLMVTMMAVDVMVVMMLVEKIDILTEDFLPQPSGPSACVLGLSPTCPTAWRQAVKTTVKPCLKIWMQSNNKWINEIFLVGLFQNKIWLVYLSDFLSPGSMSEREALCSIATSTCWLNTFWILFSNFITD